MENYLEESLKRQEEMFRNETLVLNLMTCNEKCNGKSGIANISLRLYNEEFEDENREASERIKKLYLANIASDDVLVIIYADDSMHVIDSTLSPISNTIRICETADDNIQTIYDEENNIDNRHLFKEKDNKSCDTEIEMEYNWKARKVIEEALDHLINVQNGSNDRVYKKEKNNGK